MTTSTTPRFSDVRVQLSGEDGNVFAIIGRVRSALRKAGATQQELDCFWEEVSSSGSYEEAIATIMRWVNVS